LITALYLLTAFQTANQGSGSGTQAAPLTNSETEACSPALTRDPNGLVVWSTNGKQYVVNKQDASGIYQLYVGNAGADAVCITCSQLPNGPAPNLHIMQPHWHPSGEWIELAGEMPNYDPTTLPNLLIFRR